MEVLSNQDYRGVARIQNLPNAVSDQEPATFGQLKAQAEGLAWKDNVRVATQGNISLTSPGASIDGIALTVGDRFLAKAQTAGSENGIYVYNGSATAAVRSLDGNTADELESAVVTVDEGTSAGVTFRQSAVNFTIGTGTVTWSVFGASVGAASESSAGISREATQAEVDAGALAGVFVSPAKLKLYASGAKRAAGTIGDGSATQYDITHNLNTLDVVVAVYTLATGKDVITDVTRVNATTIRLNFAVAPTVNQYRVVILG